MRDGNKAGGHDALQEIGLLQATLHPDARLKHERPQLPQPHVGEFLRVVSRGLGFNNLNLARFKREGNGERCFSPRRVCRCVMRHGRG